MFGTPAGVNTSAGKHRHSTGRLGSTTESRGEDDKQSTGWGENDLELCSVLFPIHFPWEVGQGI